MGKVSRKEVEEELLLASDVEDDVYSYDDLESFEKWEDFNLLQRSLDSIPENVTVKHEWLEDEI